MKLNNKLWILLLIGLISCRQKTIEKVAKVVSANNETAYNELKKMNLDSVYTNLLDRKNASESEYKIVLKSWSEFHKKVSKFIKQEKFKWEVPDSTITIYNRIYFDKNGTIDYYAFKIKNPSVSAEKRTEYEKVLQEFSKEVKLDLKQDEKYAQCGKIKYINY